MKKTATAVHRLINKKVMVKVFFAYYLGESMVAAGTGLILAELTLTIAFLTCPLLQGMSADEAVKSSNTMQEMSADQTRK